MRFHRMMLLCGSALALASLPALAQEEKPMAMDEAPAAALDAAKQHAGGMEFTNVQVDMDEGVETHEFSGKGQDGKMLEVDVTADGKVLEIEREIAMDEVPGEVSQKPDRYAPGFQPTFVEKSERPDAVYYELEGQGQNGELDIEIREDGRRIIIQDDTAA